MSYLESKADGSGVAGASTTKKKSPTSAAIVREGLRPNLSATEATSQLKVLCRKFAALTEKVKEETKVREEAEREAYLRELKDAHERTKQELRFEKDKNAMLVSKALELEREKSGLLAAQSAATSPDSAPSRQAQWDREQMQKIQTTLQMTIDELQDEVTRKQDELESFRERAQRERSRTKQLELKIRAKEHVERDAEALKEQWEGELRAAEAELGNALKQSEEADARADEERALREALEEQLATLNEVNAALEQRCNALIRRVELSAGVIQDGHDLTMQLRDAEIDNETLMRELKDQHFRREKELKMEVEKALNGKCVVEAHVAELEADVAALRTQNSLFSEWMLVRNENALIAKTESLESPSATKGLRLFSPSHHHYSPQNRSRHPTSRVPAGCGATLADEDEEYDDRVSCEAGAHRRETLPMSEPGERLTLFTTGDSIGASNRTVRASHRAVESSSPRQLQRKRWSAGASDVRVSRRLSTASLSSASSSSTVSSLANTDHNRLRTLMTRNRELQQRLQHETLATQNLEQEITDMATSYTPHKRY
ncbi:hypothetical protein PybrP1_005359 [[Pythium] brassicae (nom. inval.)]|nr:hypothetical protein PybrP1_005359 [[Pythium] brassicae (nom. inval.)]